jgi:hypothetical protein
MGMSLLNIYKQGNDGETTSNIGGADFIVNEGAFELDILLAEYTKFGFPWLLENFYNGGLRRIFGPS